MAQIVTITNPLTGQPAQVDQLEHTAQQIDDGVNAAGIESTDYPGCYYRIVGGVVEWLNPPMILGVEYRTTERYQGKPVYVKVIDLGALPNATSKTVEWGSDNFRPIRYSGRTETTRRFAIPYASYIQCAVSGNSIVVYTTANYSGYTASLVVYYTKGTD